MKAIYKLAIPVATLLLTGCMKNLDKDPIGLLTPEQVNTDPQVGTVTGAVNSSYQMLSNTLNLLGNWDWPRGLVLKNDFILQDIASGDMQKKWNPDGDQAWMDQFTSWSFTADNGGFNGQWSYNYEGISRSNLAISYLTDDALMSKLSIDNATKNYLLGQSYFLRAFYYFDLVNAFGDVPLLLKPLKNFNEADEVAKRVPKVEIYSQISADLAAAKGLIPPGKYSNPTDKWRVSQGAVIAMQAKVALYNQKWNDVVSIVTELEGLGYYSLNANYFDNFSIAKKYTDNEVVFAYNHVPEQTPRNGNGICALAGWGFIAPTTNFINEFETNDPRLLYTVDAAAQNVYKIFGEIGTTNKGNEDAASNKVYIRWADVLLWKAEAFNEMNDHTNAVIYINKIRTRARQTPTLTGGTVPAGSLADRPASSNKDQIKNWLVHERRVELGFESHRFNDLKRWGLAKTFLTGLGKSFQDKHYLYPIPQGEIDKSGGSITQNNGY